MREGGVFHTDKDLRGMSIKPVKAAHGAERRTSCFFVFFFLLEMTLNSGSPKQTERHLWLHLRRTVAPCCAPKERGGASLFIYFISFFPLLSFPCFVSYQSMWRDADYSAESSERRSSVTARRRARKEERSGKFNPNKWHLGMCRRGEGGYAQSSAPRLPPRTCTRIADRPIHPPQ